jgi:hypothetical protein
LLRRYGPDAPSTHEVLVNCLCSKVMPDPENLYEYPRFLPLAELLLSSGVDGKVCVSPFPPDYSVNHMLKSGLKLHKADSRKLERIVKGGDMGRLTRYLTGEVMWWEMPKSAENEEMEWLTELETGPLREGRARMKAQSGRGGEFMMRFGEGRCRRPRVRGHFYAEPVTERFGEDCELYARSVVGGQLSISISYRPDAADEGEEEGGANVNGVNGARGVVTMPCLSGDYQFFRGGTDIVFTATPGTRAVLVRYEHEREMDCSNCGVSATAATAGASDSGGGGEETKKFSKCGKCRRVQYCSKGREMGMVFAKQSTS